ncbi:MAG: phage tail sheath subtilisin-like domain-containing protein [Rikenellaceae bacterium]
MVVYYTAYFVTEIDSLLQIDDTIALKPNIIIAPGYSQLAPVFNKLSEVATKLQGFAAADIIADNVQAALTARASGVFNTTSQAVVLCYPTIERYNTHENINDIIALSVHWAAAKVLRDTQKGYWLSPSNTELIGVIGLSAKITSSLTDPTADTNLLNGQGVVTVFRKSGSGTRLWGNWTAAFPSDKTTTAMIAPRAVRMAIREALIDSSLDHLDRNVTQITIDLIVEDVNAFIRTLVGSGVIIDGECVYNAEKNPSTELAQGKIIFTYYVKFAPSTERITFEEIVEF